MLVNEMLDISKLHNKLLSIVDSEASRGLQYNLDVHSVDHDLKFLEWMEKNYTGEMLRYLREYIKEKDENGNV